MTGETKLTQAIIKVNPSGLHVLPGGSRREDVAELLSGPRFSNLLEEARKLFDYIIIDAPPCPELFFPPKRHSVLSKHVVEHGRPIGGGTYFCVFSLE